MRVNWNEVRHPTQARANRATTTQPNRALSQSQSKKKFSANCLNSQQRGSQSQKLWATQQSGSQSQAPSAKGSQLSPDLFERYLESQRYGFNTH